MMSLDVWNRRLSHGAAMSQSDMYVLAVQAQGEDSQCHSSRAVGIQQSASKAHALRLQEV